MRRRGSQYGDDNFPVYRLFSLGLYWIKVAGRLQRTADKLVAKVERWEALRPTLLGARGWRYQLREVGGEPRLQGYPLVPWRLPPLHHPRAGRARDWQTSDALRRENAEEWLFEI